MGRKRKSEEQKQATIFAYRLRNQEKLRQYNKQWVSQNRKPKGRLRKSEAQIELQRVAKLKRLRDSYPERRSRVLATNEAWRKRNLEYMRLRAHRRKHAPGHCSLEQWRQRVAYHGNACRYCGAKGLQLEIDHMIPVSRGGTNWPSNLVPACRSCNGSKRHRTYFEYLVYRSTFLGREGADTER